MATLYACIETNPNRKFRLTFQKSFSSKQPTLLSLIDFENELKYIIDDCPLDIMNSKTFSQLKNGLLSIKVSDETPNDIMVTIGSKPSLKLKKIDLTEEDYYQEQIYLLEKKYEKMIQDFNAKFNTLNEEIKFLKSKNEESSQTSTLKTNVFNQKIERLETELSRSNTNITNWAYKQAPGSFLFSLVRNGIETECKKLELIPNKQNHIHDGDYPCIFSDGNVHDLYIADNCNANTTSQSLLGNAYVSGDGSSTYLAGEKNFQVTELEYYIPNMSTYNQ